MKQLPCVVVLLVAALGALLPSDAGAAVLNLTDDAYVSSGAPNSKYGSSGSLTVNGSAKSFLKFDLSTLPAGGSSSNVVKATLTVFIGSMSTPGEIDVKRVTSGPWDEAHITAANAPSLGDPAEDSALNVTDKKAFLTFNVTALVKDWVGDVLANNGVALVAGGAAAMNFNSKENTRTAHPATLDVALSTPCAGNDPQDIMVKVGATCVDVYEASVWSAPTGGTQYGTTSVDYPCQVDGSDCTNIYARSVAGVIPATRISWVQAQQACANSGKRLLQLGEWMMAWTGTPQSNTDIGTTDCRDTCAQDNSDPGCLPVPTGSRSNCVSRAGVHDMLGNVAEFTAEIDNGADGVLRGNQIGDVTASSGFPFLPAIEDLQATDAWFGFRCGR